MIGTHAMVGSRVVALLLSMPSKGFFWNFLGGGSMIETDYDGFCAVQKRSNSARKMNVS